MIKEDNIQALSELLQQGEKEPIQFDHEAILRESRNTIQAQETIATKLLSIIGGLMATLAFTGFLFLAGLYDTETTLAVLGIAMLIAAVVISRMGKKVIWDTLSASLYLIGYISSSIALDNLGINFSSILLLFLMIFGAILYLSPSYLIRFLSVLLIVGNLVALLAENKLQDLYYPLIALLIIKLVFLFLYESKLLANKTLRLPFYNAIRTGILISLLILFQFSENQHLLWFQFSGAFYTLPSVITLLALGFTSFKIAPLLHIHQPTQRILFSLATVILFIPCFYYPLVGFSILILLLSFRTKYKTGLVLAIISFLYSISMMYYNLNYNLLNKSLMLLGTGALFLIVYLIFHKKLLSNEKY